MYKINDTFIIFRSDENLCIPRDPASRHYQKFIADVKEHGTSIVEGADVIEPDYVALRTGPEGYAPLAEQMDMQFKNDGSWEAHVQAVKDKFPKTITGGVTTAPLPQWVLDIAEQANA